MGQKGSSAGHGAGSAVKDLLAAADTIPMRLRRPTLDVIAKEYAEATAAFDFDRAEGWLTTATLVAAREADRVRRSSPITR
jgi:hypothetical protein